MSDDLTRLPAVEMAELVRKREVSAVELVRTHLERARRLNPLLNAFVSIDGERALDRARRLDGELRAGTPAGPLCGVPVTIKSSIDVAGLPSECGTLLRKGNVAVSDAPLVARLKSAGAIVLGNTNVAELLMAWETDNRLYGRTNNPWDVERTPGGSSGGEAAAIASGCSAGGVGSDGGGSIRVPAHFSGICGLKPTPGRIPATGHFPPATGGFAWLGVVGPMARTVADLRALYAAMAGPDPGDPSSAPVPTSGRDTLEPARIRIGYFEDDGQTPVSEDVRRAVRASAAALAERGFEVVPWRPDGLERIRQLWWQVFGRAVGFLLDGMVAGREADLHPVLAGFRSWVAAETPLTLASFMETLAARDEVRAQLLSQMADCPMLLCPVAPIPAFRHGERDWVVEERPLTYLDAWRYTAWFNLTGNPAVAVPAGVSADPLPVGVQLVGRPWMEDELLGVAAMLEEATGGWRPPPV